MGERIEMTDAELEQFVPHGPTDRTLIRREIPHVLESGLDYLLLSYTGADSVSRYKLFARPAPQRRTQERV